MISYAEARNIVRQAGAQHRCLAEKVSLSQAAGRICAAKILAPIDIQPFDNSAMDGFCVRLADIEETGAVLRKSSVISAGDSVLTNKIEPGTCMQIMTGALIPLYTDAVVPIENVRIDGDRVVFQSRPERGQNIRKAGQDFKIGMDVFASGQIIQAHHIMPLATLGIGNVDVYKKIRVAYFTTGNEIVDDLSKPLPNGKIYNSNLPYGVAIFDGMGLECISAQSIKDDIRGFELELSRVMQQNAEIVISSGAVSTGAFDFVRKALENIGAEVLFHKVAIKPGKPNLFAKLPNGALYFGLPGNPVATAAGLRFFVQPCVDAMMGIEDELPIKARSGSLYKKRAGTKLFLKAQAKILSDGVLEASVLDGQESFMVSPFLHMNCWATINQDQETVNVGDIVDIYPLYSWASLF